MLGGDGDGWIAGTGMGIGGEMSMWGEEAWWAQRGRGYVGEIGGEGIVKGRARLG